MIDNVTPSSEDSEYFGNYTLEKIPDQAESIQNDKADFPPKIIYTFH